MKKRSTAIDTDTAETETIGEIFEQENFNLRARPTTPKFQGWWAHLYSGVVYHFFGYSF